MLSQSESRVSGSEAGAHGLVDGQAPAGGRTARLWPKPSLELFWTQKWIMIIVIVLMNATEMLHFILIILSPKKVGHFQKTGHEPNSAPSHAASRATWARLLHNETRFRQPDDSHAPSERRTRRTSGLRMKNGFHTGTNKKVTPYHETMFCQPDDFHAPSQWRRKRSSASGKKGSYSTYLYLDFHLLSRQWLLHTGGS